MNWTELLNEYKQWVLDNPFVYNVNTGNSNEGQIFPTIEDTPVAMIEFFNKGATSCHVLKAGNKESLTGFVSWLHLVKGL